MKSEPSKGTGIFSESYAEDKRMREVRIGRILSVRSVFLPSKIPESCNKTCANILFIHGSCATSRQWNRLVSQLDSMLLLSNNGKKAVGTFGCFLFDQLGCGESKHPAENWNAYSALELLMDLQSITRSILNSYDNVPLFLVAHSYGVSQAIQLIDTLSPSEEVKVKGMVLIGGGLKGGPSTLTQDGGHWIFRYIPTFLLRYMQPSLSRKFVQSAILDKELQQSHLEASNANDMAICKAFYRQQKYATIEEALKLKNVPALVIHGKEDKILPLNVGEHLHNSLPNSEFFAVNDASHQVFEEKYVEVASKIMKFINSQMDV